MAFFQLYNSRKTQDACDKGSAFSVVYWEQKPYIFKDEKPSEIDGALPEILRSVYKACCKTNAKISAKLIDYPTVSENNDRR